MDAFIAPAARLSSVSSNLYSYLDSQCFQCQCCDCVKFVDQVLAKGKSGQKLKDYGVPGITTSFLCKSEIRVSKGEELVKVMKLSEKTLNNRYHSGCCGTPLLIHMKSTPLCFVYTCNMTPDTEINKTPNICVHAMSGAPEGSSLRIARGAFAPSLTAMMLFRPLFLSLVGSYGPSPALQGDGGDIGIGVESVALNDNKQYKCQTGPLE